MDTILRGLGIIRGKVYPKLLRFAVFISLIDHFVLLRENVTALTSFSTGEECR